MEIAAASESNVRLYHEILVQDYLVVLKNTLKTVFIDRTHWQMTNRV